MQKEININQYIDGILESNISYISKAITLVESTNIKHQDKAQEIVNSILKYSGKSIRIGITGVPGVGKSTFIESFGLEIVNQNNKLAVLAVDPSSQISKGSILGDKTRMEKLSIHPSAFIRPSPSSGSLGGITKKTRESIIICEAAGYNYILVETVGVGQSETLVHELTDFFLLLMLAGAGDELQGIKRGIMEMADAIIITKADGANFEKAKLARAEYANALHLFPPTISNWIPEAHICSSVENKGINEIVTMIDRYKNHTTTNNYFNLKREQQNKQWFHQAINDKIIENFYANELVKNQINQFESLVEKNQINPYEAIKLIFNDIIKK